MTQANDERLNIAREEIDKIDSEMAKLFEKRMDAVTLVNEYKLAHGMKILDKSREQQVIEKNSKRIENAEYLPYYKEFLCELMAISKRRQSELASKLKVGYQGVEGAFSHIALTHIFKDSENVEAFESFEDVFKALASGEINAGVLPFENSYTGQVGDILDLLYQYDCYITATYEQPISHNLLGVKGATLETIEKVYSHPQALSQCSKFLQEHNFTPMPSLNTAVAAKNVANENDPTVAAIASAQTATLYELDILSSAVNNSDKNTTKFIVIENSPHEGGTRFSLFFTVEHTAGSLAQVMQLIANAGFNMECIRSQSCKGEPWQYYFYVELLGNADSKEAKRLINELSICCPTVRLLGGYNKA